MCSVPNNTGQDQARQLGNSNFDEFIQSIAASEAEGIRIVEEATRRQSAMMWEANGRVSLILRSLEGFDQKWLASMIYWQFKPYIRVQTIADAVGLKEHQVNKWVFPKMETCTCETCQRQYEVPIRSRTGDNGYVRRYTCDECREKEREESRQTRHERELEINELKSMPYSEYLKTEHWQQKRRSALYRANYQCQVCNASGKTLHVHHRTYERRGEEYARDLIVLCADCHRTFHETGKLARDGAS